MRSRLAVLAIIFFESISSIQQDLRGKTPCCIDRLSTVACTRMALSKKKYFDSQCSTNADFALVQCCATCFDRKDPESQPRYDATVKRLVLIPHGNLCGDRRGEQWCNRMMSREGFWKATRASMSCAMFPFAFRECRNSCGFCTSQQATSILSYNHTIATDSSLCNTKMYYAGQVRTTIGLFARRFATTTPMTRFTEDVSPVFNITEIPGIPISRGSGEEEPKTKIEPSAVKIIKMIKSRKPYNPVATRKTTTPRPIMSTTVFDPLAHLNLENRRRMTNDYFVAELGHDLGLMSDVDYELDD